MHLRLSSALGQPFVEESTGDVLGVLSGILIHPDTGKVEGCFVSGSGMFSSEQHFVSTAEILRWGNRITVRDRDAFAPPEDHVRLAALFPLERPVLGQRMRTESGRNLGRCRDVQFETKHFMIEWLFPRKFFRWGIALPLSAVREVRRDAIIVRDLALREEREVQATPSMLLEKFPEVAEARKAS